MRHIHYVTIGNKYADKLGYENLVGSMGIISKAMNALSEITIIAGDPAYIGKAVDIHKEDCIRQPVVDKETLYCVVVDETAKKIFYTENKVLAHFTANKLRHHKIEASLKPTHSAQQLVDFFGSKGFCLHKLDDEYDKASKVFYDTFTSLNN